MNPPTLSNRFAKQVLAHVSLRTGISVETIRDKSRRAEAVRARRRAARLLRRLGYSLPDIGYAIDRHHTTVLHHVRGLQ